MLLRVVRHPTVSLLAKFGFAAAIIAYMVMSGRLELSVVRDGFAQGRVVLVCLLLIITATCFSFVRWRLLLRGQNIHFSFPQIARYGLIGCFFNTTMPGAVSGDIVKAWYVVSENKGIEKTPLFATILLDRVLGVFGLVGVSSVALILGWNVIWSVPEMHGVAWAIFSLAVGVAVFFLYIMLSMWGPLAKFRILMERFRGHRVGSLFLKAYDAWIGYQKSPDILAKAMGLSMMTHLCSITAVITCSQALGETGITIFQYFLLIPLGLLTTSVPIAPAGLGVGHVAFGSLFSLVGSSHGAEVFTLFVSFQILVNLTGAFFYVRSPKRLDSI